MTSIWLLITGLLIASFAVLALPLVRNRNRDQAARKSYDVAIYKDQMLEAEREHERGLLSAEQVAAVKVELQRKLLAAADPNEGALAGQTTRASPRWPTALGIMIFLGAGSLFLYDRAGSPGLDNLAYVDRDIEREQQARDDQKAVAEMSDLLDKLEARLADDSENVEGWRMLGRSAVSVGQFPRAVKAYEQALRRQPEDPDILVNYAEALLFSNEGRVSDDALVALEKAHEINAANPKARYYLALAQAQSGNLQEALQQWIDLLAISLADAPWVETVQTQIANAAREANIDPATLRPSTQAQRIGADIRRAASAELAQSAPGPSREDVEAAREMTPEARNEMIRSMVQRLADRLEENPNDRQGWLRLANAYKVLGELEKSAEALARANQLRP